MSQYRTSMNAHSSGERTDRADSDRLLDGGVLHPGNGGRNDVAIVPDSFAGIPARCKSHRQPSAQRNSQSARVVAYEK